MLDLSYRKIQPSDFDALWDIANDWSVVRQLGGWKWPPDADQVRSRAQPYKGDNGFVWAICEADQLVGTIGFVDAQIGYMLHSDAHRRGIGKAAASAALEQAFRDDPNLNIARATTWSDNLASHRLLTGLGFVHWQTRFEHALARGVPTPSRHYRLRRASWDSLKAGSQ